MRSSSSNLLRASAAGVAVAAALAAGCERPLPPVAVTNASAVKSIREELAAGAGAAAATQTTQVAMADGWGTLKGAFVLDGSPPPRVPLKVDKDQEVCAPAGKQVLEETVVVGPNNGLANVLIFVTSKVDPAWEHQSYVDTRTATVDFDQKGCVFLSHVFGVRNTQTVRILNSDPIGHNTNIAGPPPFNKTLPANGNDRFAPTDAVAEPYSVSCSIHPWMAAYMIARNNPYFAVTGPDGSFQIPHVPAGVPLEFRVWQEKAKFLKGASVNGQEEKWQGGKFKLTLAKDETRELSVKVSDSLFK